MNTKLLRQKVLGLAIHGKLVPQNPEHESAADLLEKIRETDKNYNPISIDEIPFEIPENWCWCRLPEACSMPIKDGTHQTPTYSDKENGIPFLSSKDVTSGKIDWNKIKYITKDLHEELYKRIAPQVDDILLAKNGTTGIAAIVEDNIVFDIYVTLAVIRPNQLFIYPKYLLNIVNSSFCKNQFNSHLTGIGVPNLHLTDINKTIIPLPPLEEQKLIVEEIERIFALIDTVEQNKTDLETVIKQTKSKILDLAIHGKLVPQDEADEPASKMLEKLRAENTTKADASGREKIAKGQLKRDKNDSYIYKSADGKWLERKADGSEEEIEVPFEIPESWSWCRGKEIFLPMTTKKPYGKYFSYIDIDAIDNLNHQISTPKEIETEKAPSRASRELKQGDVLFSMVRPYLENIALVKKEHANSIASTGFYICRPNTLVDAEYLFILMTSSYVIKGINQFMKGDNSPSVNGDDILRWLYPIPPSQEQVRIGFKINKVNTLINQIMDAIHS